MKRTVVLLPLLFSLQGSICLAAQGGIGQRLSAMCPLPFLGSLCAGLWPQKDQLNINISIYIYIDTCMCVLYIYIHIYTYQIQCSLFGDGRPQCYCVSQQWDPSWHGLLFMKYEQLKRSIEIRDQQLKMFSFFCFLADPCNMTKKEEYWNKRSITSCRHASVP